MSSFYELKPSKQGNVHMTGLFLKTMTVPPDNEHKEGKFQFTISNWTCTTSDATNFYFEYLVGD